MNRYFELLHDSGFQGYAASQNRKREQTNTNISSVGSTC
jgi:hypothetical protein